MSRASRAFPAMYDGECDACGEPICAGDQIRMTDGEAIHEECCEYADLPWEER